MNLEVHILKADKIGHLLVLRDDNVARIVGNGKARVLFVFRDVVPIIEIEKDIDVNEIATQDHTFVIQFALDVLRA